MRQRCTQTVLVWSPHLVNTYDIGAQNDSMYAHLINSMYNSCLKPRLQLKDVDTKFCKRLPQPIFVQYQIVSSVDNS